MFGRKKGAEGSVLQELCHFAIRLQYAYMQVGN